MTIRHRAILGAALATLTLAAAAAQPQPAAYHLAKSVPLGSPDRWDYVVVDPPSHRVFVAHGDRVSVVDGRDGRILGQVEGMPGGTHGTGISAATGQGFTDDGKAGQVVAFDLKTLKVLKRLPATEDADGIVTDPATGHVFVMDGDSGKVTVVDPKTDTVIANIEGGGKLEAGVVGDGDHLYVDGAEKREVLVIGTRDNRIDARWAIPACVSPHGVAADAAGHRLFVSCVNAQLVVLNTQTGAVVATLAIGKGSDAAAWDPKRKLVFSSNGADGTISVIQQKTPDNYVALPPIKTAPGARTMGIDPATGRLYVAAAELEPPAAPGGRPKPKPGTLRLMFFDPAG
jgi:YVTN family beta-propeller protein